MIPPVLLWIPVTLAAALFQTVRNAAQRHLIPTLGTPGATLVRFLYGLPFAALWLAGLRWIGGMPLPQPNAPFLGWVVLGALAQIAATALLLRVMTERNFALGIAYSKTEVLQVAVFAAVFLGDPLGPGVMVAVGCATLGVLLLSPMDSQRPLRTLAAGWTPRTALLGVASGTCLASPPSASGARRSRAFATSGPSGSGCPTTRRPRDRTTTTGGW